MRASTVQTVRRLPPVRGRSDYRGTWRSSVLPLLSLKASTRISDAARACAPAARTAARAAVVLLGAWQSKCDVGCGELPQLLRSILAALAAGDQCRARRALGAPRGPCPAPPTGALPPPAGASAAARPVALVPRRPVEHRLSAPDLCGECVSARPRTGRTAQAHARALARRGAVPNLHARSNGVEARGLLPRLAHVHAVAERPIPVRPVWRMMVGARSAMDEILVPDDVTIAAGAVAVELPSDGRHRHCQTIDR
eukprot:CAMPEP_0175346116 /NCGR_PEP_ID=MMETSP0095-20121207/8708_1 /TAXON_ID=311494 /ORGANISM="Alexandrium monilatum, Strain CCMP3105" /LENGTH=253 /DNA_ID=CAMNT_0016643587 /DNA_START=119 /DNA_END=879 /DNA_ORIENTATION=-